MIKLLRNVFDRAPQPTAKAVSRVRPEVEALEDRNLPAPIAPLAALPPGIAAVFTGDVNNDARTDLIEFTTDGRWLVSLNTSTPGSPATYAPPTAWATWSPSFAWRQLFVGDFNGDNKTDVAGFSVTGDWFVGLSNGASSFVTGPHWANFGTGSAAVWNKVYVADFNGDGKDDVAALGMNGKWFVGLSQHPGLTTDPSTFNIGTGTWANFGTGSPAVWIQTFVGDFNGDGKADIAGFGFNGNWDVGLSNGASAFTVTGPWANWGSPSNWMDAGALSISNSLMGNSNIATAYSSGKRIRLFVGDFNGDGKVDIAGLAFNGSWFVGLSDGTGSFTTGAPWANWGNPDYYSALFVGNVNGDVGVRDRDDIIGYGYNGNWFVGLSQSGTTTPSDTFVTQPSYANWGSPSSWAILAAGHAPDNYNSMEYFTRVSQKSTRINSTTQANDFEIDVLGMGFNRIWFAGISTPTPDPNQFLTNGPAVEW